uniref:Uncharacterized protein n=1 Tax=Anolis carolinensis TaxID=28377 RepID=A0A803SSE1_ANOCA
VVGVEMAKVFGSLVEFQSELADAAEKLVVIDFSPFFHSLVEKYPDLSALTYFTTGIYVYMGIECLPYMYIM